MGGVDDGGGVVLAIHSGLAGAEQLHSVADAQPVAASRSAAAGVRHSDDGCGLTNPHTPGVLLTRNGVASVLDFPGEARSRAHVAGEADVEGGWIVVVENPG